MIELIGYITSSDDRLMNDTEECLRRLEKVLVRWQDESIRRRDPEASTEAAAMRAKVADLLKALKREERDEGGP